MFKLRMGLSLSKVDESGVISLPHEWNKGENLKKNLLGNRLKIKSMTNFSP